MLILDGSPHAEGVTSALAAAAAQGGHCRILHLRDYSFFPCVGCNYCAASGHCKWSKCGTLPGQTDQAEELFAAILSARALIIAAPIYFYALPGFFKGFIDRSQPWWHFPIKQPSKPAAIILAAGHQKGEKLFTGALLTLKYFLQPLAYEIKRQICLRGLENVRGLTEEHLHQTKTLASDAPW